MRLLTVKSFWVVVLATFFLMPPGVYAQKQPSPPPPAAVKQEQPPEVPDLADLLLQAIKLSSRRAALETIIAPGLDVNALEKDLQAIEVSLAKYPPIIEQFKESPRLNFDKLTAYKAVIRLNEEDLKKIIEPLTRAIKKLAEERKQWLAERKRWQEWESALLTNGAPDEIKSTFPRAQKTIDSALLLINQKLQPLLALLQSSGTVDSTINRLIAELDVLTQARRRALVMDENVPLCSWSYLSQLKALTWSEVDRGMQTIGWPKPEYFRNQGWILILQVIAALAVILMVFWYREELMESERWRFLGKRPLAAGLVLGIFPFYPLMEVLPASVHLLYMTVGGLAAVRLLNSLLKESWQKLLLFVLAFFIISLQVFHFINLPGPFIRLYVFITALVGLSLCAWRARVSALERSPLTTWLFRLGGALLLVVLIAELVGYSTFAEYLFRASLRTLAFTIITWLGIYLACGVVEGVVRSDLLQSFTLVQDYTQGIIRRTTGLVKVLITGMALAMILMVWGVYDNPLASIQGMLSWGVTLGSQKITVALFLTAAACLYGAFLLSWVLQNLLTQDKAAKKKMGPGGQQSLASLIQYALVFVGVLLALGVLGIDLTKITIVLGALGVGIGFGLQQIVNNLVCGIILLVERPIRVEDYLEVDGQLAVVKRIGLRATRVQTFDRSDIMIPNADLITNQVTNWTYSDRFARLKLPVGVAYGTDTAQVLNILKEIADKDPAVVQYPAPSAFFNGFGDSSLNFELRVYLLDIENRFSVRGRINQEIERKLREAGINIPFPQRDLHLRSVDQPFPVTAAPPPEEHLHQGEPKEKDKKEEEEEYYQPPDL